MVCVGGIGFIQSMFSSSGGTVVYGKIPDSGHWIFFQYWGIWGGILGRFLEDFLGCFRRFLVHVWIISGRIVRDFRDLFVWYILFRYVFVR